MGTMLKRSITAATLFAAIAATPAHATPTIAPLKACYVAARDDQREYVTVNASGFTPLTKVDVFIDNIQQPEVPLAAFDGSISGMVRAPFPEVPQRAFELRLTEEGSNPPSSATADSMVTRLSVEQVPKQAQTNSRVRFRGRGFTQALPVYAHYVFAGKSRKTVNLGMPAQACGLFSVKRKQFPFKKRPQVGVWTIQFDQSPKYDPRAPVRFPLNVRVNKRIKRQPAH
jgi:hypothetical protein